MDIVIVGAGIGGLSCALALARDGHKVRVLESAGRLAEIGAGVQLTPDAIKFFWRWGLREDILAKGLVPDNFVIHRWDSGEVLRVVDVANLEGKYGAPYLVVHRGVLHDILHRHVVKAGAEVRVNARVVEYDFEKGVVVLHTGERIEADLVVACDGINSFARKHFLGDDSGPQKTGWAAYRMMVDVAQIREKHPAVADLVAQKDNHLWIGDSRSAMTYMIYESTVLNMVMSHRDDVDTTTWTPQQYLTEVRHLFDSWDPRLTALIDLARPTIQNWPVYQVPELRSWTSSSGKFVMMGDAAHAMAFYLSMGISMAVEDAVALAQCLSLLSHSQRDSRTSPSPTLTSALKVFESLRKPRAEAVQRASLHAGNVLHMPAGPAQRKRDVMMKVDGILPADGDPTDREFSYGIADKHTRDWCYGYDAAEEVSKEWNRVFG